MPSSSSTANAGTSAMASSLPGRSGLPTGDLFSPTRNAPGGMDVDREFGTGHGSIDFENSETPFSGPDVEGGRQVKYTFRGSRVKSVGNHRFTCVDEN